VFLSAAVGLIVLIAVIRTAVCWANDTWVDHPTGVIIAMAADLKDGMFYRPLFGPAGYGGTRYFPLYFSLHAVLLKLGLPVLPSAYLISGVAVLLLLLGTFRLLRRLGTERWLAVCSAGAILAAASAQMALTNPHGDGLASALNVCALAVLVRPKLGHRQVVLASILFTLAWSAKANVVFGFVAAFVWLLACGARRTAGELAAMTGCGCVLVAGVMMVASQGRVWEVFKACASGGANHTIVMLAPIHVWRIASHSDRGLTLFFFLAVFALLAELWTQSVKVLRELPVVFFVTTAVITIAIFASPGVVTNHLIDMQVASVILFTFWLVKGASARQKQFGLCALALATAVAAVPLLHKLKVWDHRVQAHRFQGVVALIEDKNKPILAENPVIPVLAGQRAYVLDPWMLRMLRERIPNFGEPLLEGLRHQAFGAVVLAVTSPGTRWAKWWYESSDFGPGFLSALTENYRLASVVGDQMLYLPIKDPAHANRAGTEASQGTGRSGDDSGPNSH
jgi:hypothetical protein